MNFDLFKYILEILKRIKLIFILLKLIYGMVWNEKVVIKFELFFFLDFELEDEEIKNK